MWAGALNVSRSIECEMQCGICDVVCSVVINWRKLQIMAGNYPNVKRKIERRKTEGKDKEDGRRQWFMYKPDGFMFIYSVTHTHTHTHTQICSFLGSELQRCSNPVWRIARNCCLSITQNVNFRSILVCDLASCFPYSSFMWTIFIVLKQGQES